MKSKSFFSLLIIYLLIAGILTTPAEAVVVDVSNAQAIARATDRVETSISAYALATLGDSVSLDSGEVVTFIFTYTPSDASIKFGVIAPDGYFYGLSGSNGNINKGIRVEQRGTYTLAIWNKSANPVRVVGTVNY